MFWPFKQFDVYIKAKCSVLWWHQNIVCTLVLLWDKYLMTSKSTLHPPSLFFACILMSHWKTRHKASGDSESPSHSSPIIPVHLQSLPHAFMLQFTQRTMHLWCNSGFRWLRWLPLARQTASQTLCTVLFISAPLTSLEAAVSPPKQWSCCNSIPERSLFLLQPSLAYVVC